MKFQMQRISDEFPDVAEQIRDEIWDVIVVGTGYGGAIPAAKLAEVEKDGTPLRILVLERGKEILPGDYPTDLQTAASMTQVNITGTARGAGRDRLLDVRVGDDVNVVIGCGLGGTSLLNAGVALPALDAVFKQTDDDGRPFWPAPFSTTAEPLKNEYAEASKALGANPLPDRFQPNKLSALEKSAKDMGYPFERMPINVTFEDSENTFGNFQPACTHCGDCISGCNYAAKNTLLMNYLPYASANGAKIVTSATVRTVLKGADAWEVAVAPTVGDDDVTTLRAARVILAAGTLGTTEILQRSSQAGLPLSTDRLGERFSGNGDVLSFGFDANWKNTSRKQDLEPVYSVGAGANPADRPRWQPGPCITGGIKVAMEEDDPVSAGMIIQEGVIPGALAAVCPAAMFFTDVTENDQMRFPDSVRRLSELTSLGMAVQSGKGGDDLVYKGAVANSQTYLVMSHDDSSGRLVFDEKTDTTSVDWKDIGRRYPHPQANEKIKEAADAIWANYLPNPIWTEATGWSVVSVHPVGGCVMAESAEYGVVDADCRVFTGNGTEVHDGLFVTDGAVIPTSIGLNPLLTISAIAIRASDQLIAHEGWTPKAAPRRAHSCTPPGDMFEDPWQRIHDYLSAAIGMLDELEKKLDAHKSKVRKAAALEGWMVSVLEKMGVDVTVKMKAYMAWCCGLADFKVDVPHAITDSRDMLARIDQTIYPRAGRSDVEILSEATDLMTNIAGKLSPSLSFGETMTGSAAPPRNAANVISDPFELAEADGLGDGRSVAVSVYIDAADIEGLLSGKTPADLTGSVTIGDDDPVHIAQGTFSFLQADTSKIETWKMIYDATLEDGRAFRGEKTLARREGSSWQSDVTQMDITIGDHEMIGRVRLHLTQLAQQVGTIAAGYHSDEAVSALAEDLLYALKKGILADRLLSRRFLNRLLRAALTRAGKDMPINPMAGKYVLGLAEVFTKLVLRSYGRLPAYMLNFPAQDAPRVPMPEDHMPLPNHPNVTAQPFRMVTKDGNVIGLTRFQGGRKGPVLLAPGFSVRARSFALLTNESSLVEELVAAEYDVWTFDYRASPDNDPLNDGDWTIDDVAKYDWPLAVETVLENAPFAKDVQIIAHCIGGMSAMMSRGAGYLPDVRQMIISQMSMHPVSGALNQAKSDVNIVNTLHDGLSPTWRNAIAFAAGEPAIADFLSGMRSFDVTSRPAREGEPSDTEKMNMLIDAFVYKVPFGGEIPCSSPSCHRIYAVFGPSFSHAQVNEATHNAMCDFYGRIATFPFKHLSLILRTGKAVDANGTDRYFRQPEYFDIPVHFIAGARNRVVMPDSTLRTMHWLKKVNPGMADLYTREIFPEYGHMDCFVGRRAHIEVGQPLIAELDKYN